MARAAKKKPLKSKKTKKLSVRRILKKIRKAPKRKSRNLLKKNKLKKIIKSAVAVIRSAAIPAEAPLQRVQNQGFELPSSYHETKLTLLVRDPWWIFAFWEVTPEREREVLNELLRRGLRKDKTVLRVYEVTGTTVSRANDFFDIELHFFTNNWYIDVGRPDSDWAAEIGLRATDGSFFPFVRSNTVRTPRFGISDVLDEEWMMPDELYWKLFGWMKDPLGQKSSLSVKEILERYLKGMVSSEGFAVKNEQPSRRLIKK